MYRIPQGRRSSRFLSLGAALRWLAPCLLATTLTACASPAQTATAGSLDPQMPIVGADGQRSFAELIDELADKRVVYVGEIHDRYDHHLVQLEIIRRLHAQHAQLAIGMEFFQQPHQDALDAYVAGAIDEHELLQRTEYYKRWGFDFRLYAPILRYAREHNLPLVALNIPAEITAKISRGAEDTFTAEEKALLPETIDRSDQAYIERLKATFGQHPHGDQRDFERFVDIQLLWDESMAQRAAEFLKDHPEYHMVVLAGSGHLAYGSGIPDRVERRVPVDGAIVINDWETPYTPELGDYLLSPEPRSLPAGGMIGAQLASDPNGLQISACMPGSPCERLELQQGDKIVAIDGASIGGMADLRLAMWDKNPGDVIDLEILRPRDQNAPQTLHHRVILQAPQAAP
jgi:uncharacterized iron-regulated protein